MKKVLFSALACVAFAGSGFAANEIVVENQHEIEVEGNHLYSDILLENFDKIFLKKDCKIEIRAIGPDGNSSVQYAGSGSGQVILLECDGIRKRFEADLRESGYSFTDDDVTLHWGYID